MSPVRLALSRSGIATFFAVTGCGGGLSGAACASPSDFAVHGDCDAEQGWFWNGEECISDSGCGCTGADCGRWARLEACQAAHRACPAPTDP